MKIPLGVVLTVVTDIVLAPWEDAHGFAEYLAGEQVWTHQIPRVFDEAKPLILTRYPGLADIKVPAGLDTYAKCDAFLATLTPVFGAELDIDPLSSADHTSINPLSEMAMNHPHIGVVPFVTPGESR